MYALIFTNTVLGTYFLYIIAEKRQKAVQNRLFWGVLSLLIASVAITVYTIVPNESMEVVKTRMFP